MRLGYQELYLKTEHNRNSYEQLDGKVFDVISGMTSASFLMNKALARSIPLDLSTFPVSSAYKSPGPTRQQIFAFSEDIPFWLQIAGGKDILSKASRDLLFYK